MKAQNNHPIAGPCLVALLSMVSAQALPAPVFAQGKPLSTLEQAKEVRRSLDYGARCLLRTRPDNVRHFLGLFPDSKDGVRAAAYLIRTDCVDGAAGPIDLTFAPSVLRGALFKALYIAEHADGAPPIAANSPDYRIEAHGAGADAARDYAADRQFADCVVRKDPDAARAMVLAEVESPAEMAARARLDPDLGACTTQKDAVYSRMKLSGLIAESLYRLTARKAAVIPGKGVHA